ncbi:MAG: DNA repair protein RadC [Clostridia bacterium]|nr:DNA repair protein RadC [Clostridia bacterium]
MKMKDLPETEKPYEKLESYGAKSLSDAELLAIIIKSGTKSQTAVQVAQQVLTLDKERKGLNFLTEVSIEELQKISGLGRVKTLQIKAVAELANRFSRPSKLIRNVITCPEDVANIVMGELKNESQEIIKTVILNNQNELMRIITNSIGTINSNVVEIREILKEPVKTGAAKIILIHNHPSGNPEPSRNDISFSIKIRDASEIFGIELLDHIIIGDGVFVSLKRLNKF